MEEKNKTLMEEFEKIKKEDKWNELDSIIGLLFVWALFGNSSDKSKTEELERRIAKLEAKNEIIEKVLF